MLAYTHDKKSEDRESREWANEGFVFCKKYEELKPQGTHNTSYFTVICLKLLEGREKDLDYLINNQNLSIDARNEVEE